jgi:hypothetical protein
MINYEIELCEPLVEVEREVLKMTFPFRFNHKNYLTFENLQVISISLPEDMEPKDFMVKIAGWLANVNADEDIFAIHKTQSFYTGYVNKEIKELMDETMH